MVFTKDKGDGRSEIWLAFLDHRSSPRLVTVAGDEGFFGADGDLIFRSLGEKVNRLTRIKKDGSGRRQVSKSPILDVFGVSPDGSWIIASPPQVDPDAVPDTLAMPADGGVPLKICAGVCRLKWSPDERFLYVTRSAGTLVIPIPPGRQLPEFPFTGIGNAKLLGVQEIARSQVSAGSDPSVYAYTETRVQHNLFRIPLH